MLYNIPIHRPETNLNFCSSSSCPLDTLFPWAAPPPLSPPAPAQPPLPVDRVDRRDWEDHGFDQNVPGSPPKDVDIDIALAVLLKGLPGINAADNAEELDGLLKDLSYARTGRKGWNLCQRSCRGVLHMLLPETSTRHFLTELAVAKGRSPTAV